MENDDVVGMVMGLKFQNIPRRALNIMLPPPGGIAKSGSAPAKVTPAKSVALAAPTKTVQKPTKAVKTQKEVKTSCRENSFAHTSWINVPILQTEREFH